jgi:hypothetical protein
MNQITRLRKDRAAEPVLAESLKEQAYEAIKHRIITCAFKPGQELSESAVAALSQDWQDARSPGLRPPEYGRSGRRSAAQGRRGPAYQSRRSH